MMKKRNQNDIKTPRCRSNSATVFENQIVDELITAEELAARLKVKISTIRNWRYTRAIPEDCMVVIGQKLVRYKWKQLMDSPFMKGNVYEYP
jgi:hypothetical protein